MRLSIHASASADYRLISIHAPREGCDDKPGHSATRHNRISIHAPREGCDSLISSNFCVMVRFQSTHPVRGATLSRPHDHDRGRISIHAPREGCDFACFVEASASHISIHAPREGCDDRTVRRATRGQISIHAPREGCDGKNGLHISKYGYSTHSTASIVPYDSPAFSPICESAESICQQITHS